MFNKICVTVMTTALAVGSVCWAALEAWAVKDEIELRKEVASRRKEEVKE